MLEHLSRERFSGQTVGVLLGGDSAEREISLRTGKAFIDALTRLGYDVRGYDFPAELGRLIEERPAAVVLGLHGGHGENGAVQGLLEVLGIPYTGSGVLASALAMDKGRTKALLREHHVPVAKGIFLSKDDFNPDHASRYLESVGLPNVVKLNDSGSSVGVYCCETEEAYYTATQRIVSEMGQSVTSGVLIEELIRGHEYSVGFFDSEFLGAIAIQPAEGFYDYNAKYQTNTTSYIPVEDQELLAQLEVIGRESFRVVGCQGVARVDIIGTPDNLRVLEINTIPGMTATSLVPKMAARLGLDFDTFTEYLLASAHM